MDEGIIYIGAYLLVWLVLLIVVIVVADRKGLKSLPYLVASVFFTPIPPLIVLFFQKTDQDALDAKASTKG